jgi:transcriptional regulator with PAS, ATPase and Fis domain
MGIMETDEQLKIIRINNGIRKLTGMEDRDLLERNVQELPLYSLEKPGQRFDMIECSRNHKSIKTRLQLELPDRTRKPVLFQMTKNGNGFLSVITDLSDISECDAGYVSVPLPNRKTHFHNLVGKDDKMQEIYRLITVAAETVSNVLISGESGTGKELVARAIHDLSPRKEAPFVAVNCSALPEQLLESELFGHVKGAFTGAIRDKIGRFEAAEGGTLFLDEIGEISPLIQVKLLRVIQEKTVERVGSNTPIKVDMRIIGATNRNLREMVREGTFREDLFYRLNVLSVRTIPLREIGNDIPLFCDHFLQVFREETGRNIRGFTDNVMRLFMEYCWPGNIRELRNCIEHAFVVSKGPVIDVFDLPQELRISGFRQGICGNRGTGKTAEPDHPEKEKRTIPFKPRNTITHGELIKELKANNGNKSETARQLGISRTALWKKIKNFGIE